MKTRFDDDVTENERLDSEEIQNRLASLLERRATMAAQLDESRAENSKSSAKLGRGEISIAESSQARSTVETLQAGFQALGEEISAVESLLKQAREQDDIEVKASEARRLAALAAVQKKELYNLLETAHREFLKNVERILDSHDELDKTRRAFRSVVRPEDKDRILRAAERDNCRLDVCAVTADRDPRPEMKELGWALDMALKSIDAGRKRLRL